VFPKVSEGKFEIIFKLEKAFYFTLPQHSPRQQTGAKKQNVIIKISTNVIHS
jgi:hypothetical protein